jgi:tetratricopeptide (TPR) repeat protein
MLADRGVLTAGERAYELVGDLGEIQVPETLHALIASRLDGLGAEDRGLLQDAAILGKSFPLDALAAVTAAEPASLETRLLDLTRKEFLVFEADPRSPERGQYAFVQSIIREVAYGMLSKSDRRSRHLAAAHHLEAAEDDELAGVVAAHYVEALRATPEGPDADALAARARDWLGQAAGRATSLGSPDQALVFAEQALAITPGGVERADLLRRAARAASDALRPDQAIAYLGEAVEELHVLGDIDQEASATLDLVFALSTPNRVDDIRSVTQELERRMADRGDELARAQLDHALAYVRWYDDDLEQALASLDRALPAYERARVWDRVQRALVDRANSLSNLGRHREATLLRRGMLAAAVEEGDLRTQATSLVGLSLAADDWGEALTLSLEAAAVAHRGGYGGPEMTALGNGVEFAVETGQWAVADELMADLRSRSDLPLMLQDVISLDGALLAAYRGDLSTADATFASIRDETAASADASMRAWYRRVRGVMALMAGDVTTAFDETIGAVEEEPLGPNAGPAAWFAGRAAFWLGDLTKARRALNGMPTQEGRWHVAARRALEAGVDALEGRTREAAGAFDSILASRLAAGDPFMHALLTADAVAVLPRDLVPEGAVETARAYLEELGGAPLLARLETSDVAG